MSHQIHLEMFEGPLDLLLFLVKRDDLDVHNIPIAHITTEYLAYLDLMKELNLDVAGEFLVMAATLMGIKARALLPSQAGEEEEAGPDPTAELKAKLIEYQKFKAAAKFLETRADEFKDVFYRGVPHFDESEKSLDLNLFDLLGSLREILDRGETETREVAGEEFPIEEKMAKILFFLEGRPCVSWEEIFSDERKRRGILACFLAMLELVKMEKVFVRQEGNLGPIMVHKKEVRVDVPDASVAPGG
ncbi:MAG TPA: segregation/condensation protein A [Elusimicrobia bacterium]|nr:segregation/condensation protein A [Elusimicrobiota bacterium]HBT60471.1 segregation/condensation protein A [Elusimicrobiota bacterium]